MTHKYKSMLHLHVTMQKQREETKPNQIVTKKREETKYLNLKFLCSAI